MHCKTRKLTIFQKRYVVMEKFIKEVVLFLQDVLILIICFGLAWLGNSFFNPIGDYTIFYTV